jgi:hypothetical protein
MLLIPRITFVGAALLVCTMTGAVAAHLFKLGGSPAGPLVLLMLSGLIIWGRFDGFTKSLFNPVRPEKPPVPIQPDETIEA